MDALIKSRQQQKRTAFSFLLPDHPFYAQVVGFESIIHQSKACHELMVRFEKGLGVSIHAEIKTRLSDDGRLLDRFYYSIQYPDPKLPGGHYAWSLHYSAENGTAKVYEFPDDPKLAHLADFINAPENHAVKVLRYVPLRRMTFLKPRSNNRSPLIGKLKKRNRAQAGYLMLAEISAVCQDIRFAIPRAEGLDNDFGVFYQTRVPGEEITNLLNSANYQNRMAEIGKLHAELGKLPFAKEKRWDRDGIQKNLSNDLAEIVFYLPKTALFIAQVGQWLHKEQRKTDSVAAIFCHGDFACSQILRHSEGWSVVDFDLAGTGNPYQDMALFIVSLSHDVPLFQKQPGLIPAAAQAYLSGYQQETGQAIDSKMLVWHLVCAEIYYLALILKKDRFTPLAYQQVQNRLSKLIPNLMK
jgi:thiamine kinase-like enzyme